MRPGLLLLFNTYHHPALAGFGRDGLHALFRSGLGDGRSVRFEESAHHQVAARDQRRGIGRHVGHENVAVDIGQDEVVTASGKQVVLVGAGDSASDCISVALRQGCRSITQLIRKPRTERTEKRDHAHEEAEAVFGADIRRYETQIERLVCGDDDSVNAVILQGSGEQLPCDLLLLASGFSGCEPASVDACEAVRKTGVPALTAGDMASGASLVVLAAASGKQAAAQADASLMGYTNIL